MPELKVKSIAELRRLSRRRKRPLIWYHDIGSVLNRELPVIAGVKRHGAVRRIAEIYFGDVRFASTLYGCRRFAEVIDRREVLKDMAGINWAAAHFLMSVESRRLRSAIVKKVLKDRLKSREVRLLIQERLGKRSGGGRKTKVPMLEPRSALRAIKVISDDWVRHIETWTAAVADETARPRKRLSRADQAEWLELVEAARSSIIAVSDEVKLRLRSLSTGRSRRK